MSILADRFKRPSDLAIDVVVANVRENLAHYNLQNISNVYVGAIADQRDEARAQLQAAVALLRDDLMPATWPGSFCSYPLTERCCWAADRRGECYQHRKRDFLANHPAPAKEGT